MPRSGQLRPACLPSLRLALALSLFLLGFGGGEGWVGGWKRWGGKGEVKRRELVEKAEVEKAQASDVGGARAA
eukprot:scaffold89411_cov12-Tisochrysis_lutea.AAC.1